MNVLAAFRAEVLKLRKRPAVWILLATLAGVVLLFGYVLLYTLVTQAPPGTMQGLDAASLLDMLRPEFVPAQVLGMVAGFGGALGLILGALVFGGEYAWATVKTMTTQRPQRLALIAGRILAVLLACLVLALAAFVGGVAGTAIVSLLAQGDTTAPAARDVLSAFGVAGLVIAVWSSIGMCLATVFRGTGWAIGLGLLYAFAVESVLGLLPLTGRAGEVVARALIGNNTTALVTAVAPGNAAALGTPAVDIDPGQAVAVLAAYLAVAVVVAIAVFVRRDIAQ